MEPHKESTLASWSVPQCPFSIEYNPRVLDDIRLAVMDAFFSLPRGGAEIGGILLGQHEKGRVQILDSVALPCEHASGPSFLLSPKDHTALAEMLAAARGNPRGAQPVGWYHSHTRSEIFLSETDLEIHKRYFPEPWQIALVLKPHTFQPTQAGFFFREADGYIQESASYREFPMVSLAAKPLPPAEVALPEAPAAAEPPVQTPPEAVKPAPEFRKPAPQPVVAPVVEAPAFASMPEPKRRRGWLLPLSAVLVFAMVAAAFFVRDSWQPLLPAFLRPPPDAPHLGLNTLDTSGQLQIRWDHKSAAVRDARDAILTVEDGPMPESIELDPLHLQAGTFTYARRGARVDVKMTLILADGSEVREATSFLGQATPAQQRQDDAALRQQVEELKSQLEQEQARNRELQQSVKALPKRAKQPRERSK